MDEDTLTGSCGVGDATEDTRPKRGRPAKNEQPETAETFETYVEMIKAVQLAEGKTRKGEVRKVKLTQARGFVNKGLAKWTDPRPDLK